METKPIGGIKSVSLFAAGAVGLTTMPIEVELTPHGSLYEQRLTTANGIITVEHTLKLVAHKTDAQKWCQSDFINHALIGGLVADVTLNDGQQIRVGYSDSLLDEQPLRLESVVVTSENSIAKTPTVTLTLSSQDTTINV